MEQQIIQIGNSVGVTLPSQFRNKLGLKKGDKVVVEMSPDEKFVVLSKKSTVKKASSIDPEFKKWLKSVLKEDAEVLDELKLR